MNKKEINQDKQRTCQAALHFMTPLRRAILMLLLFLLTVSSTWAQNSTYPHFIEVVATTNGGDPETSSYIDSENTNAAMYGYYYNSSKETPAETEGGSARAWGKEKNCIFEDIRLYVKPKSGYSVSLRDVTISYYDWNLQKWVDKAPFCIGGEGNSYLSTEVCPSDDADVSGNTHSGKYGDERILNVYSTANFVNTKIYVDFKPSPLTLQNNLGGNAAVTFYDGGTTEPTNETFNTSSPGSSITSINAGHYVVMHIVPDPGYWTDLSLLSHQESGTSTDTPAGLTLLKRDQYDAAISGDPDMRDRLDGAGWYYYILPGSKTVANGYTTSSIDGEVVDMFNFSIQTVSQDFDNKTVTVSRPSVDTWTATLTYDKFEWKFAGSFTLAEMPKVQSVSIKKGGVEKFLISDEKIATQVTNGYDLNQARIDDGIYPNYLVPQSASAYSWFTASDYSISKYKVLVPFDGDGSSDNPWQINTAADLSMLAKCVNIGGYTFKGETLKMGLNGKTYDMSGSDFEPIGIDRYLPFCGTLLGNGSTIKNISYVFTGASAVSDEAQNGVGFIGNLGDIGEPNRSGNVENIRLEKCRLSSSSDSETGYVGSIAGAANRGSISNCYVIGGNVSAAKTGSYTGAIVGKLGTATLTNNYYDYTTTATLGSSTASGYTKRGIWDGTKWDDATTSDGAVLWVKKATISETKPTGSTSSVAFSQVTKGTDCYDISGDDFYYAVNQPITLTLTLGTRNEDIRTFCDELKGLTVSDGTTTTDIIDVLGFTMPETGATVTAKIEESSGFTIPSNGKSWMSLFHEWTDANKAPVDYTVTAVTDNTGKSRTRAVTNPLELLTIKEGGLDLDAGTASTLDLGGISYNGVPTLLHQEGGLPEKLRFDPVAGKTAPQYDPQFIGGVSDLSVYAQKSVFMLFNSELVRVDLSGDTSGGISADQHRAFVVASGAPAASRLMLISDDTTGIHSIDSGQLTVDDADGKWYGIDGRKLQGKPTKGGLYIKNGKKVVIK